MGFLKKIFRRKQSKEPGRLEAQVHQQHTQSQQQHRTGKWNKRGKQTAAQAGNQALTAATSPGRGGKSPSNQSSPLRMNPGSHRLNSNGVHGQDPNYLQASFTNTNVTERGSDSSGRDKKEQQGTRFISTGAGGGGSAPSALQVMTLSPDTTAPTSSSSSHRLSHQQLQQFERQQQQQQQQQHSSALSDHAGGKMSSRPIFAMSLDVPPQQLSAMDDMNRSNRSDASSSSFNLSTDAEDSEYESIRRRGFLSRSGPMNTSASVLSQTPSTYTTDDERLFPALHTDDDDDMTEDSSRISSFSANPAGSSILQKPLGSLKNMNMMNHRGHQVASAATTPSDEPGRIPMFTTPSAPSSAIPSVTTGSATKAATTTTNKAVKTLKSKASQLTTPISPRGDVDFRAWNISPNSATSSSIKSSNTNNPSITPTSLLSNTYARPPSTKSSAASSSFGFDPKATSRNVPGAAVRNFTSPKSHASSPSSDFSSNHDLNDDFANFDDFHSNSGSNHFRTTAPVATSANGGAIMKETLSSAAVKNGRQLTTTSVAEAAAAWKDPLLPSPRQVLLGSPPASTPPHSSEFATSFPADAPGSTAASSSITDPSLSELLAQAKNKRTTSRHGGRHSTGRASSVNSAPAITASYLRQQHGLHRYSSKNKTSSNAGSHFSESKDASGTSRVSSSVDGTSVSDIILNLEASNPSSSGSNRKSRHHSYSVGETGAVSAGRALKERLREKRRHGRLQKTRSTEHNSDSDNSDQEPEEAWLFDEVTGALGPRGIAADLESLSGRSNRSKSSQGNKSHRSHKSRSRRSSSRANGSRARGHHKSSGDGGSVDSRGSRTSRNSRYSHRSTKSYLSQMSEQSRSVANDLLRLEMQLAMVGSSAQENRDDVPVRGSTGSVGGTSIGGASRASRASRKSYGASHHRSHGGGSGGVTSSSGFTRRQKVTVLAPPGKLGIILANKADSKGTVVSGVRSSSALAEKISPGDRIIAIDGEDVSRMTVSEITTIMSRKADYERTLAILTTATNNNNHNSTASTSRAGTASTSAGGSHDFTTSNTVDFGTKMSFEPYGATPGFPTMVAGTTSNNNFAQFSSLSPPAATSSRR